MSNTRLNDFISYGTNAQRLAFTPSVPSPASGNSPAYIWYETDTTNTYAYAAGAWHAVNNGSGAVTTTGTPASGELAKFSGSGTITNGDLLGDVTTSGTLVTTIAAAAVTLAKMANLAANSFIGNNTGSAATPIALTQAQATALLNAMVGDSGSGGTKGLVPAPATGDAAAGKYLKADGTWAAPSSGGDLGAFWAYEEQSPGTAGGTSTANTWMTRVLNTNPVNSITGASLSSNVITLPAGTYDVAASAPTYSGTTVSARSIQLYNSSDSAVIIDGDTIWNAQEVRSHLQGRFTLAAAKNVVLRSIANTAVSTNGLGVNSGGFSNSVPNHFSDIFIRKVA
jgi:hypothetical protein